MKTIIAATILILGMSQNAAALTDDQRWQQNLISNPSQAVLEREAKGFVFVYDGFTDAEVDRILDEQFQRIDSMMFTRVKLTTTDGDVQLDPVTGEEMYEEDGCD